MPRAISRWSASSWACSPEGCFCSRSRVFPQPLAVLLAMVSGVLLTGGFHEDGLADACDGFGRRLGQAPQILAIMKDSRVGSYGVLGLVLALALKFAALAALPACQFLVIAVAAHAFSRFMAVIADLHAALRARRRQRTRQTRRAKYLVRRIRLRRALRTGAARMAGIGGVAGAAGALVLRLVGGPVFYRRIGGYTGDCLGAVQQITEIGFYLALARMDLYLIRHTRPADRGGPLLRPARRAARADACVSDCAAVTLRACRQ